jgi:hypothetical protein
MAPRTSNQPTWRDVLELQKEMRSDLAAHRLESREDHAEMNRRLGALEAANQHQIGQQAGERRILGLTKGGLSLIVSIAAGLAAAWANLTR